MGMDLNALKAKLKTLEEGKPKSRKWKPKDEHIVRALPLEDEEDLAFVIKWHYGVDNGRQIACPGTWGDECPFCDLAQYLKAWKDENGKDKPEAVRKRDWEWFKKVDAAVKHYVPVVERVGEKLEGPFLWEMTPKTYTALIAICANDERNEMHKDGGGLRILTSPSEGVDIKVSLKKKGEKGNATTYDLTAVEGKIMATPLIKGGDKAAIAALIAKTPVKSDIANPVTTEQAEKVFNSWKGTMNTDQADTAKAGVEHGATGDNGNGESVASGGKSVDETVAKLEKMLKGQ